MITSWAPTLAIKPLRPWMTAHAFELLAKHGPEKGFSDKRQSGNIALNRVGQIASHTAAAGSYPNIMLPGRFSTNACAPRRTTATKRNAAIAAMRLPSWTGGGGVSQNPKRTSDRGTDVSS